MLFFPMSGLAVCARKQQTKVGLLGGWPRCCGLSWGLRNFESLAWFTVVLSQSTDKYCREPCSHGTLPCCRLKHGGVRDGCAPTHSVPPCFVPTPPWHCPPGMTVALAPAPDSPAPSQASIAAFHRAGWATGHADNGLCCPELCHCLSSKDMGSCLGPSRSYPPWR